MEPLYQLNNTIIQNITINCWEGTENPPDKLLLWYIPNYFLEYPIIFQEGVSKSKGIIEYSIKIVDVTENIEEKNPK